MADESLMTREGLILKLVESIASAEGKALKMGAIQATMDRAYTLDLVVAVRRAVDSKST